MQVPVEWPARVAELYQPAKVLGQGGFASVVLAVRQSDGAEHAIKVVTGRTSRSSSPQKQGLTANDMAYAVREIDILRELDHVNIVKLVDHWEEASSSSSSSSSSPISYCVMALSYARGPTLQQLLDVGGRLSLTFARVVCAQLVDAVEYLHGRAVVHRDIKPDNMIISVVGGGGGGGDYEEMNEIWDDVRPDANEGGDDDEDDDEDEPMRWRKLVAAWKLTLIDFGFARALTPDDVKKKPEKLDVVDADRQQMEKSGRSSNFSDNSLRRSLSRRFLRRMSAVGNRSYAAPEIINGVHDTSQHMEDVRILTSSSGHFVTDVTRTLSEHVAYYGLLVDSYSVGNVIRYCMTGVAPHLDVSDTIALENHVVVKLCGCLCALLHGGHPSHRPKRRRVQYRSIGSIPREVMRLMRGLLQPDSQNRTSMRAARLYPWVNDILVDSDYVPPHRISYLSFAGKEAVSGTTETVHEDENEDPTESSMTAV